MRDGSLVAFTLLSQGAAGTLWSLLAVRYWGAGKVGWGAAEAWTFPLLLAALAAALLGLAASFLHLGRPLHAWRALANLRSSWLSREVLFASLFTAGVALSVLVRSAAPDAGFLTGAVDGVVAMLGFCLVWSMAMAYRLRTVPSWDTWMAHAMFFGSALTLGSFICATGLAFNEDPAGLHETAPGYLLLAALLFLFMETASTILWLQRLATGTEAEREAFRRVVVERRSLLLARLLLTALVILDCLAAVFADDASYALAVATALLLAAQVLGRSLFYEARVRAGL